METLTDLFQDIKFRERFRGYDSAEVDAYVVAVAKAAAQLQGRLMELQQRAAAAEALLGGNGENGVNGDAGPNPYQVLALAQRTADAAVAEARQEASSIVEAARRQAEQTMTEAADKARAQLAQADGDARSRTQEAEYQCSLMRAEAEADRERMVEEARRRAIEVAEAERDRIMAEVNALEATRTGLRAQVDALSSSRSEHLAALAGSAASLQTAIEGLTDVAPPPRSSADALVGDPGAAPPRDADPVNEPAFSQPVSSVEPAFSQPVSVEPAFSQPVNEPASVEPAFSNPVNEPAFSQPVSVGAGPESEPSNGDEAAIGDEQSISDPDFDTSGISDLVPPTPPNRLVTATDIDMVAAGLNVLDRRQTSASSALLDPDMAGPATQPMSAVVDAAASDPAPAGESPPLFDGEPDNGLLVEQLRQAVTEDDPLPGSDEAMVAFFGSDPGAQSKGWFRARR